MRWPPRLGDRLAFAVLFLFVLGGALGGGNTIHCIANTGGTCATSGCFKWRGPTDCNAGRCFCSEGTCANGNGTCTEHPYIGNDTQYRIKNARWPDFYVDADLFGNVDVESRGADEEDNRFTISMPHQNGKLLILLVSVRWPKAVLQVYKDGSTALRFQTAIKNVDGGLAGLVPDPSIQDLGLTMCIAPWGDPEDSGAPVMLSSFKWPNEYLYVPTYRSSVDVQRGDPGAGGYWWFEPPLPPHIMAGLPRYHGQPCKMACGGVGVAGAYAGRGSRLVTIIVLAASVVAAPAAHF